VSGSCRVATAARYARCSRGRRLRLRSCGHCVRRRAAACCSATFPTTERERNMKSRKGGHDVCRGVRWWRAAGITVTQAGSFGALGERLRIGSLPGVRAEHFGGDPENHYF
jgi:hypothetical protein